MADQDELFYLQPGFDLNTLTVPRLRSILVAHDINYPSSAKKGDLVNIVEQHLLPQARKLLRDRDRVRRTSRGITDVPSSQEDNLEDDSDARKQMPPPAPRTPRSRKSRSDLAHGVEPTPKTASRSKTPSTRRTTKTRVSEPQPESESEVALPSTKKSRKSAATPQPVNQTPAVSSKVSRRSRDADDSPFTQDNPFQQASSPPSDSKNSTLAPQGRKSIGGSSTRKSVSRRRTRSPTEVKREEYEIPISHLSTSVDGIETTEEFTADARQELGRDMQADRRVAKVRNNALVKHRRKPKSPTAQAAPWTVLGLIFAATAGWYRQEKVAVGYCGVGQPEWSLAQVENVPAWVHENLSPQCEPCPSHATCYPGMKVECDHDFVLREHPLSLNGIVPIPPTCEPDSAKEKKIELVARKAIHELRENTAEYECGSTSSSTGRQVGSTVVAPAQHGLSEEELKERVARQKRKGLSEEEFEDLWGSALGAIKARDEVNIKEDRSGTIILSSSSFANLPLSCAIRRSAIRTVAANRVPLLFLILLGSAGFYGRKRLVSYNTAKSQTPSLVALALDRLATQAAMKEDGRVDEAFISVGQLRDDVLRNVFDRVERERVWNRVRSIVESNSNVRAATREGGKTGEWSRVWEWIGPVNFVPGLEGRRSGGMIESSPATGPGTETPNGGRNWDEGRAIY